MPINTKYDLYFNARGLVICTAGKATSFYIVETITQIWTQIFCFVFLHTLLIKLTVGIHCGFFVFGNDKFRWFCIHKDGDRACLLDLCVSKIHYTYLGIFENSI